MGVVEDPPELQVASGVVLGAQPLSLSVLKKARSCRQQLDGVKEQLGWPPEKVSSVGEASAEANILFKRDLATFQMDSVINLQCTARAQTLVKSLHKEL